MILRLRQGFSWLREWSVFLLLGTVAALVWANAHPESYRSFVHHALVTTETLARWASEGGLRSLLADTYAAVAGLLTEGNVEELSFDFIVNDLFMVLFFGIAAKEVSESFLPGGALSSVRNAAMPVVATIGGVVGPVGLFFLLYASFDAPESLASAWAVPAATDIAYSWLFAGIIFGRKHAAVTFLLVVAVLDDLIGMLIIAVYYTPEVEAGWLLLVVLGVGCCELMRRGGVRSFWPYVLIGGTFSWFGLHYTGVHASLALVPIVPFMPHAERDFGLFEDRPDDHDTMNRFEHVIAPIVDIGLLGFGLANAGVALNSESLTGAATWIIFLALVVGKTTGIFAFAMAGRRFGLTLPPSMTPRHVLVLGCTAGIGFTVALFVATVAVEVAPIPPDVVDMLKLGALLSFAAGPLAWLLARSFNIRRLSLAPAGANASSDIAVDNSPAGDGHQAITSRSPGKP